IAQTSLLKCAVDISPRKKLMHTMPPNTDRPINRAMVVGCAVSATRNHLKLHEPRRLKVLFSNIHAKTRKLWKHSAMRLAASRTNVAHQFTNRPLMNSVCPPHCTLPGSPACAHAHRLMLAPRPPSRSPPTYDPHSTRCTAGCHTSRDFVPWRFSDAGRRSAWIASSCRCPKTYTTTDIPASGCDVRKVPLASTLNSTAAPIPLR